MCFGEEDSSLWSHSGDAERLALEVCWHECLSSAPILAVVTTIAVHRSVPQQAASGEIELDKRSLLCTFNCGTLSELCCARV